MYFARDPMFHVRRLFTATEYNLRQMKFVRWVCGGLWFRMNDVWSQADGGWKTNDGTRFLTFKSLSFHETNMGIQALEDYT